MNSLCSSSHKHFFGAPFVHHGHDCDGQLVRALNSQTLHRRHRPVRKAAGDGDAAKKGVAYPIGTIAPFHFADARLAHAKLSGERSLAQFRVLAHLLNESRGFSHCVRLLEAGTPLLIFLCPKYFTKRSVAPSAIVQGIFHRLLHNRSRRCASETNCPTLTAPTAPTMSTCGLGGVPTSR